MAGNLVNMGSMVKCSKGMAPANVQPVSVAPTPSKRMPVARHEVNSQFASADAVNTAP
jgi:hypothetical protein